MIPTICNKPTYYLPTHEKSNIELVQSHPSIKLEIRRNELPQILQKLLVITNVAEILRTRIASLPLNGRFVSLIYASFATVIKVESEVRNNVCVFTISRTHRRPLIGISVYGKGTSRNP